MGKQNPFLAKQEAIRQKCFEVACDTTSQQFFDYMCIVLNDPEIMGKDIFGRERIEKVFLGLHEYEMMFDKAYTKHKEADVAQKHLDDMLREVYGDDLVPFAERQPDVLQMDYSKARKGWVD